MTYTVSQTRKVSCDGARRPDGIHVLGEGYVLCIAIVIEVNGSIICASIPALKPIYDRYRKGAKGDPPPSQDHWCDRSPRHTKLISDESSVGDAPRDGLFEDGIHNSVDSSTRIIDATEKGQHFQMLTGRDRLDQSGRGINETIPNDRFG